MKKMNNLRKVIKVGSIVILISITPLNAFASYSGTNAANYAKRHATSYNSSFPEFPYDCTNFASQCVYAGGISMNNVPTKSITYSHINDIFKTKDYWSTGKYTRTTTLAGFTIYSKTGFVTTSTWSVVAKNDKDSWWGLYNYMKSEGASTNEYKVDTVEKLNTFIKDSDVGDVLQIRSGTDQNKWHSVIVTDKSYDNTNKRYDMKIAYHTNDTPPTDFRTKSWTAFGKDKLWTVIKVSKI